MYVYYTAVLDIRTLYDCALALWLCQSTFVVCSGSY